MTRKRLKLTTLKALFAKSGNQCAFPDCTNKLIVDENIFVGQVAHIKAASSEGPRYDENLSDEERREYDNLILLCYEHHKIIDSLPERFDAQKLIEIKKNHESEVSSQLNLSNELLNEIARETEIFWQEIDFLRTEEHPVPDLAVGIDVNDDIPNLIEKIYHKLDWLNRACVRLKKSDQNLDREVKSILEKIGTNIKAYEDIPYYRNPFINRNWETHTLDINNHFTDLDTLLKQLEIKIIEVKMKSNPKNEELKKKYKKLKNEFREIAQTRGYID